VRQRAVTTVTAYASAVKWIVPLAAAALFFAGEPAVGNSDVGNQRVLIVLATWGPQPFAPAGVMSSFAEAARFYDKSSFHQLALSADVTPWLPAFTAPAACPDDLGDHVPVAFSSGPNTAAAAAGYRVESYDRVIYVTARMDCDWDGLGVGHQIVLNADRNWNDMVHELGHTYGLAHARRETCRGCSKEEYGDPFSPMGHGQLDFSAYEKLQMGWLHEVAHISRPGTYTIGRPDIQGATPYALVIETGLHEYWVEQRLDATPPGLVVRSIEPDLSDFMAPPELMLWVPALTVGRGETFRVGGVFSVRDGVGSVRFTWLDRKRPTAPTVSVRAARVAWSSRDNGSGIASCTVAVDGRPVGHGAARGTMTLSATKSGTHRVAVACVDRAGNRSRPTVRRFAR
jgi:Gametolysin peptidase M11